MVPVEQETAISSVLGEPRESMGRHDFRGSNFVILQMLNRYRNDLGVEALPQELEMAARGARDHLGTETAQVWIDSAALQNGRLTAEIRIENLAGHKLPTAYPSRRVWVHLKISDQNGEVVFESGRLQETGAIEGNDNDADPARFEPHYEEISAPDQVQIYESILVGPDAEVTTGLLRAVRYAKDNRILPDGFDKQTADDLIAVHGSASDDADFLGGSDRLRYTIELGDVGGPVTVETEVWYQPIGFRWAENLRTYESPETRRFVDYYDSMSASSGAVLARAVLEVE
jgi:hypothetical protein